GLELFLKNLEDRVDDKQLSMEFSLFGTIISAQVKMENGWSKGFGFVCFASMDTRKCIHSQNEMDGRIWDRKLVHIDVVQRKEERKTFLPQQTNSTIKPSTCQMITCCHWLRKYPTRANKITWMLLEGKNNYNIMNMIGHSELLHARVVKIDTLLKAREADRKPVRIFDENWSCSDDHFEIHSNILNSYLNSDAVVLSYHSHHHYVAVQNSDMLFRLSGNSDDVFQ
ncbi:hypothetical protein QTP86_028259, partial [Hemibagrus guttatus]